MSGPSLYLAVPPQPLNAKQFVGKMVANCWAYVSRALFYCLIVMALLIQLVALLSVLLSRAFGWAAGYKDTAN